MLVSGIEYSGLTFKYIMKWSSWCLANMCPCLLLLSCSVMSDSATPWTAAHPASLSFNTSQSLLKLMSIKLVISSSHLILCCPLLLLSSILPSIRVFSNESVLRIRCPKYWSYSFNISLSKEYLGLFSFTIDQFDLLALQGTLRIFSNTTVQKHQFFGTFFSFL